MISLLTARRARVLSRGPMGADIFRRSRVGVRARSPPRACVDGNLTNSTRLAHLDAQPVRRGPDRLAAFGRSSLTDARALPDRPRRKLFVLCRSKLGWRDPHCTGDGPTHPLRPDRAFGAAHPQT